MEYTEDDYRHDLGSGAHLRSRERFKAFYDRRGRDAEQKAQEVVMKRFAFVQPHGEIIELGCHIGFNLIHLATAGYAVTGVDVSSTLLAEARRRVAALPPEVRKRITLVQGFIEALPEDKCYDTVVLTETLEHVIEPDAVVRKAAALTKPGGKVFVSAPMERLGTYSHVRGIGPEELRAWLEAAGLEVEKMYTRAGRTYARAKNGGNL